MTESHPIQILVIDDDQFDRMNIRRVLKESSLDAVISEAHTADIALNILDKQEFDCIFLDYILPGEDGIEVLKKIRDKVGLTPIIVLTGQGDQEIAVNVMKSGATDYIIKESLAPQGTESVIQNAIRISQTEKEKQAALLALEESEARLAHAQRIARLGSWEVSLPDQKINWSSEISRILGIPDPEFQPDFEFYVNTIAPDDRPLLRKAMEVCIRDHQEFSLDIRVVRPDGQHRNIEITGMPDLTPEGNLKGVKGTVQDITSRKKIESDLIKAKEEAEQSAKARQEFVANVSHEIRTPMNAIVGYANLLMTGPLTPEQREYLDAILVSGDLLLSIINDILDFSKIESGKFELQAENFDLPDLIRSVEHIFRAQAAEKGVILKVDIAPSVPRFVKGDSMRLSQVVVNLVNNALKFTPEGSVVVRVTSHEISASTYRVSISVIDTGIGIPPEKQEKIFDSFSQAETNTARKFGGTGLGLTISKRIIDLWGGEIKLESEVGRGSTFTVDLTLEAGEPPRIEPQPEIGEAIGNPENIRILLAEDNILNQKLASRILEKFGFRVEIAQNGLEAVEMAETGTFHIVLMDVQMPGMDGYAATKRIRKNTNTIIRELPVIALTAHAIAEERQKCFEAGMNDFISKPFRPEELRSIIFRNLKLKDNPRSEGFSDEPSLAFSHFAPARLMELADGDESFRLEMTQLFLEDGPAELRRIEAAVQAGDLPAIHAGLHRLKPSLELFGIKGWQQLAASITNAPEENSRKASFENFRELLTAALEEIRQKFT